MAGQLQGVELAGYEKDLFGGAFPVEVLKGAVGDEFVEDPGFPTDVRDTTAAGEAFNAGVLYAMREGLDPARTLRFANAVASLFLEKKGEYGTLSEVRKLTHQ